MNLEGRKARLIYHFLASGTMDVAALGAMEKLHIDDPLVRLAVITAIPLMVLLVDIGQRREAAAIRAAEEEQTSQLMETINQQILSEAGGTGNDDQNLSLGQPPPGVAPILN